MNETTIKQTWRLIEAGCPEVSLRMDGHHVTPEPLPLGKLWDIAHKLELEFDFPLELTSNELVEELVTIIEDHYHGN